LTAKIQILLEDFNYVENLFASKAD
jgi:hypothetical protein